MKTAIRAALAAATVVSCVVGCADASDTAEDVEAAEASVTGGSVRILALGDSITWGGNPRLDTFKKAVAGGLVGYPELLAKAAGGTVVNGACPGETSHGFLRGGAEDVPDNGCHRATKGNEGTPYTANLRARWSGKQADFMVAELNKPTKPSLVVISLGGNDLFVKTAGLSMLQKPAAAIAGAKEVEQNYYEVFRLIESTGYTGPVAVLNLPDLAEAAWAIAAGVTTYANSYIKQAVNRANSASRGPKYVYVDLNGAWNAADDSSQTCLNIFNAYTDVDKGKSWYDPESYGNCDAHPTKRGYQVLANAVVDALKPLEPSLANVSLPVDP